MDKKQLNNAYYVSWEAHQRTRSICKQFGIPLYELVSEWHRILRYAVLIFETLSLFLRRPRNDIIIVQTPSIVLALLANLFAKTMGRFCVVDCHNGGITPLEGRYPILNAMAKLSIRLSNYSIVTNQGLAQLVKSLGGRPIVLPDPLPDLEASDAINPQQPTVVFICTWASDEPYLEVLKACQSIDVGTKVYITGNYKRRQQELATLTLPKNAELTGFISEEAFHQLLEQAWVIMDLTTREDCLVCGAYEATAMHKPMILSDTQALRRYFSKGSIYTQNDAVSIASAIDEAIGRHVELLEGIKTLKSELLVSWQDNKQELIMLLNQTKGV